MRKLFPEIHIIFHICPLLMFTQCSYVHSVSLFILSISSSSCTASLRSSTTASTSALVVPLPTLSLKALAATSDGTPQLRRIWEGLVDRHGAVQGSYVTTTNVRGKRRNRLRKGLFYLFPLSEWQAAPMLASSLVQLDNTFQPKAGDRDESFKAAFKVMNCVWQTMVEG